MASPLTEHSSPTLSQRAFPGNSILYLLFAQACCPLITSVDLLEDMVAALTFIHEGSPFVSLLAPGEPVDEDISDLRASKTEGVILQSDAHLYIVSGFSVAMIAEALHDEEHPPETRDQS